VNVLSLSRCITHEVEIVLQHSLSNRSLTAHDAGFEHSTLGTTGNAECLTANVAVGCYGLSCCLVTQIFRHDLRIG